MNAPATPLSASTAPIATIAWEIWDMKYRYKTPAGEPIDITVEDTWRRVARALAQAEPVESRDHWEDAFFDVMAGYRFLPAGRILAGAGTGRMVTLQNCFVMGRIPDSMGGIFEALKESALTLQQGGGIGNDFSTLRPSGATVAGVGADASGPLSFMDVWDAMCRTIMSAGSRRGAMMATLRCDHPDIEAFVEAKRDPTRLRNFNLSVLATDPFMEAVKADVDWPLVFDGKTYKVIRARELWNKILQATYDVAEPGVIFIDRMNELNNLNYCETHYATNPCGEQNLPPYGACLLGSVNLAALVKHPYGDAYIDHDELEKVVRIAVRMMDNVIDVSNYPLPQQQEEHQKTRRIGLGVTGLADALAMCGYRYGTDAAAAISTKWMEVVTHAAYRASTQLAKEKGKFPAYASEYLSCGLVKTLPADIKNNIALFGIRNALVTSIAPTGTISLFAGNVSSGVEPIFAYAYDRKVLLNDGTHRVESVVDHAVRLYSEMYPGDVRPDHFVTADDLTPSEHLKMQAALQPYVDSSISKTINVPKSISFDDFKAVYEDAYDLGLKGCTTYRPNDVTGSVLSVKEAEEASADKPAITSAEAPPPPRQETLTGKTYKIKFNSSEHALYVTINDLEDESGRRPYEIFLNSKNMEHYAWAVALTRMVSAVFRRGGDIGFVVEELKAVFDPRGGHFYKGKYVPSTVAAIGGVIEQHLKEMGEVVTLGVGDGTETVIDGPAQSQSPGRQCPRCLDMTVHNLSGCDTCMSCGHSKCG